MKLYRKQVLNVLLQFCVFEPMEKQRLRSWQICRQRCQIVLRCRLYGPLDLLLIFVSTYGHHVLDTWHFLYNVGPHPVSSLHILVYTFVVSRAIMMGAASQVGDADSSRAPGLTSGLQGSVNVYHGALLLVPQWQCISSFVFYSRNSYYDVILEWAGYFKKWLDKFYKDNYMIVNFIFRSWEKDGLLIQFHK